MSRPRPPGSALPGRRARVVYKITAEGKERFPDLLAGRARDVRRRGLRRPLRLLLAYRPATPAAHPGGPPPAGRGTAGGPARRTGPDQGTSRPLHPGTPAARPRRREREVRWLEELIATERREQQAAPPQSYQKEAPWAPSVLPSSASETAPRRWSRAWSTTGTPTRTTTSRVSCTSTFGDYHVRDIEFVAAFDVDAKKVGRDLSEAIFASENNTIKIADVPPPGITVQRGPTLDGLGEYYREIIEESDEEPVDVAATLREAHADVLVCYLPVGSEDAAKFYAQAALDAERRVRQRPAGVHRGHPGVGGEVHRGRCADRRRRHQVPGRRDHRAPRAGQALRGPRRDRSTARTSSTSAETWTS